MLYVMALIRVCVMYRQTDMRAPILRVQGVCTEIDTDHGVIRPVDGVDLALYAGETLALVGESGCGKSMTALTLMRLLPESARIAAGEIHFSGRELVQLPEAQMRRLRGRRIAMIFQEPASAFNPVLTIGAQIGEVLQRHYALHGAPLRERVISLLVDVGIPDPQTRIDAFPFQLSGGLKQRAMIALALAADPEVLIADEPSTALDVTLQAQLLDLLRELQQARGMAMLLITHDLGVVAQMAHRVALMYAGQIVEVATREAFFSTPHHPYARQLFAALPTLDKRGRDLRVIPGQVPSLDQPFVGCRFAERCAWKQASCVAIAPPLREVEQARWVRCVLDAVPEDPPGESDLALLNASTDRPTRAATPLVKVRDLVVHFPIRGGLLRRPRSWVRAVDGVSFDLLRGRTLALVGESGSGKTTVGLAILRLLSQARGQIYFDTTEISQLRSRTMRAYRRRMQIIFQDPYASLNPRMQVGDLLLEGMTSLGVAAHATDRAQRVRKLLDQVGIAQSAVSRYPHEFSGGQRQRIAIARALAVEPALIVCDEPTSALDVSVQAQILNLLRDLQQRLGLTYLFITHNLAVVDYLAHDVAVMYQGRIVEQGTTAAVLHQPQHPYTQRLLAAVPRIEQTASRR